MVTWSEVPDGHRHGTIEGYIVTYKEKGSIVTHRNETKDLKLEIQGLRKFWTYEVRVAAFSSGGTGNFSDVVIVRTNEDGESVVFEGILFLRVDAPTRLAK